MQRPTGKDVRRYQADNLCSLQDAKKAVMQDYRRARLTRIRAKDIYTVLECAEVIAELLEFIAEEIVQ